MSRKGKVQVLIECGVCGESLLSYTQNGPDLQKMLIPDCPNCDHLTYGPLTEENINEALASAVWRGRRDTGSVQDALDDNLLPLGQNIARFVVRLLRAIYEDKVTPDMQSSNPNYWRKYLHTLARQP